MKTDMLIMVKYAILINMYIFTEKFRTFGPSHPV